MCDTDNFPADDRVARMATAFEVVDWVRLVGARTLSEIRDSFDVVTRLHLPALADLAESLDPNMKLLWDGLNIAQEFSQIRC